IERTLEDRGGNVIGHGVRRRQRGARKSASRSCWSMASPHSTISAADQDPRPVGGGQDLPVACGNSRGPADVVVARELDHHGFLVTQFGGCQASVVPVEAPPGREREPETNGERGEYAPDRPEIGVTLADIVEQGRPNQVGAVVRRSLDAAGRLVSVTLVGAGLAEERSEGAGASGEPLLDL